MEKSREFARRNFTSVKVFFSCLGLFFNSPKTVFLGGPSDSSELARDLEMINKLSNMGPIDILMTGNYKVQLANMFTAVQVDRK